MSSRASAPHGVSGGVPGTAVPGASTPASPPPVATGLRWADLRLLLIGIVLFGGVWPITKDALRDATPLWFAFGRCGLACLAAILVLAARGRLHWPGRRDMPAVLGVGLLQLGAFFALAHLGLLFVSAGRTAVLANFTLVWLIPLSVLVLGDRISPWRWGAVALGMLGVAALAGPWAVDWGSARALFGNGALLLAALAWAVAIILSRLYPPRRTMFELMPWYFGTASLMLLALALWREPAGGVGPGAWPHLLGIGLLAAPLGTWAVIEAGRRLPPVIVSVGFLLAPLLGVSISTLWLGEPLGWDLIAGGLLIVASVFLASRG